MATKKAPQTTATSGAAAAPAIAPVTAAPKKRTPTRKPAAETASAAPKKATAKKAPVVAKVEPVIAFTVLQDEIRTEAYDYFIQREYRAGDPTADWHRAEDTVLRRYGLR